MIRKNPCHDVDNPAGQAFRRAPSELSEYIDKVQQEEGQTGLVDELMHTLSDIKRGHLRAAELRITYLVEKLRPHRNSFVPPDSEIEVIKWPKL